MFDNKMTLTYQKKLEQCGYLVGAIRKPTVEKPILRIIPRLGTSLKTLKSMLYEIKI
jgi:8-amino-7-oxononanoate synthase